MYTETRFQMHAKAPPSSFWCWVDLLSPLRMLLWYICTRVSKMLFVDNLNAILPTNGFLPTKELFFSQILPHIILTLVGTHFNPASKLHSNTQSINSIISALIKLIELAEELYKFMRHINMDVHSNSGDVIIMWSTLFS